MSSLQLEGFARERPGGLSCSRRARSQFSRLVMMSPVARAATPSGSRTARSVLQGRAQEINYGNGNPMKKISLLLSLVIAPLFSVSSAQPQAGEDWCGACYGSGQLTVEPVTSDIEYEFYDLFLEMVVTHTWATVTFHVWIDHDAADCEFVRYEGQVVDCKSEDKCKADVVILLSVTDMMGILRPTLYWSVAGSGDIDGNRSLPTAKMKGTDVIPVFQANIQTRCGGATDPDDLEFTITVERGDGTVESGPHSVGGSLSCSSCEL